MNPRRPDTHVQFRLPPEVGERLDERAQELGRSRAVTAKLLLTKQLHPPLYRAWMSELRANPARIRLPKA
jgi:hypothetical protein